MKVRLPKSGGMGNIKDMASKVQEMQSKMEEASSELDSKIYDFTSGGGAVKAEVKGCLEIINLDINFDVIDKEDKDMLEETIIAAVNGALKLAKDDKDSVMKNISENMGIPSNIPGLF